MQIDVSAEASRLAAFIDAQVRNVMKKTGVVIGISGGIDSSVVAALCVKALGKERVLGILLPEKESSPSSTELAQRLADQPD
jgi:NAD+ synthase